MISREATDAEVREYLRQRRTDSLICVIPDCRLHKFGGKGVCQGHYDEFERQRDSDIWDFRIWALTKMGVPVLEEAIQVEEDAFAIYERLRRDDP